MCFTTRWQCSAGLRRRFLDIPACLSSLVVGGARMGLRNLRELMQSFWLNPSKEISLMLSRITHKELKEDPWTEGTPGFSSQLCFWFSVPT